MIDTRALGQELQDQVLAAARKGQQRVTATVRTMTATAEMIRPQLQNLPRPTIHLPNLPKPGQVKDKAPSLTELRQASEQFRSGAQDLAGQFLTLQRKVAGQLRDAATPLAHQAAAVLTQVADSAIGGKATDRAERAERADHAVQPGEDNRGTAKAEVKKATASSRVTAARARTTAASSKKAGTSPRKTRPKSDTK